MTIGTFQPPYNGYGGVGQAPTIAQPTYGQEHRYNNEKPRNIFGLSFPHNHLLLINLVFREVLQDLRAVKIDRKERHFFFVMLAPGIGDGSNRTYDLKNQKVSMKFSLREIASLGFVLKQCAIGNEGNVLPYTKFTKSNNQSKNCSVWMTSKLQTVNNQQVNQRVINLGFNGANRYAIQLSPAEAYGIGEECELGFKKGFELELEWRRANPEAVNQDDMNDSSGGYAQPAAPAGFNVPGNVPQQPNAGFFNPQPQMMGQQFPPPQVPTNVPVSPPTSNMQQTQYPNPINQPAPGQYPAQFGPQVQQPIAGSPSFEQQTSETTSQFGRMLLNTAK